MKFGYRDALVSAWVRLIKDWQVGVRIDSNAGVIHPTAANLVSVAKVVIDGDDGVISVVVVRRSKCE